MPLPRKVEVGPFAYKVLLADIEDFGQCDHDEFVIRLRRRMARETARETFFHELLHACCEAAHVDLGEVWEEHFVRRISPILLDTLRRNPNVIDYLTG